MQLTVTLNMSEALIDIIGDLTIRWGGQTTLEVESNSSQIRSEKKHSTPQTARPSHHIVDTDFLETDPALGVSAK